MPRTGLAIVLLAIAVAGCNRSAEQPSTSSDKSASAVKESAAAKPASEPRPVARADAKPDFMKLATQPAVVNKPLTSAYDGKDTAPSPATTMAAPTAPAAAPQLAPISAPVAAPASTPNSTLLTPPIAAPASAAVPISEPAPSPVRTDAAPSTWQSKPAAKKDAASAGPSLLDVPATAPSANGKPAVVPFGTLPDAAAKPGADAAGKAAPKPLKPEVSVVKDKSGMPTLRVKHRWVGLRRPSIQTLLVTDPQAEIDKLKPMNINGADAERAWQNTVGRLDRPATDDGTPLKNVIELIEHDSKELLCVHGRSNTLKKNSAYGVDQANAMALAFYRLDDWADTDGSFRLALDDLKQRSPLNPENKYVKAGRLRVWFLDEEKVVWSETVDWPGDPKVAEAAASKPDEKDNKKPPEGKKPEGSSVGPGTQTPPTGTTPTTPEGKKPETPGNAKRKPVPVTPTEQPESTAPAQQKPAEQKPAVEEKPVVEQPARKTPEKMTVEELAQHIEKQWGAKMQQRTRKLWQSAWSNYFQVDNVPAVRREVFMKLLREMYNEQEPDEMRRDFALLYTKIKELDTQSRQQR